MKNLLMFTTVWLLALYLDGAFAGSQVFSQIYIVPCLTICFWLITEHLRKDRGRVAMIVAISALYGVVTNVSVGLLALTVSLFFVFRWLLNVFPNRQISESELLQTLGFFYLFTLGLFVLNKQEINFVAVTLVVILNSLIAWFVLQLLKFSLRTSSYA